MKKIYILLTLILGYAVLLSSCTPVVTSDIPERSCPMCKVRAAYNDNAYRPDNTYHKIDAERAKQMIDEGDVIIVDVRTAEEYEEKHIPSAVLVPNDSIADSPPALLPDKDAVLLVHCRTGVRSSEASDKLIKIGYTQVYDFGGIEDWPYETESGSASK